MKALIVGGSPEVASTSLLRKLAGAADVVVAVDRGLDALLASGLECDLFCGDADTVGPEGLELVESGSSRRSFEVERYRVDKDATDLELALDAVRARWGCVDVIATCLSGGKPDHFLAALGRLLSWREGSVYLVEDGFTGRLLHEGESWDLSEFVGRRFSFVPLSACAEVSERGMRWTLDHARVELLSDRGIANELDYTDARITCHSGALGAWVYSSDSR